MDDFAATGGHNPLWVALSSDIEIAKNTNTDHGLISRRNISRLQNLGLTSKRSYAAATGLGRGLN